MKPVIIFLILFNVMTQAQASFVNWENHPVHAIDISPDKNRMAVAHTADNRVQLFDISLGYPVKLGHVKVGINPVSVRFKNNEELWAVNHISDSVSVVNFNDRTVIQTIHTNDEPHDVVFANGKAFVSCSQPNQVQVFNENDQLEQTIDLKAEEPRSMVVDRDGTKVYVAAFESGNRTTVLGGDRDENGTQISVLFNPVNRDFSPYGGVNPPPNDGQNFMPQLNPDNPVAPKVSLIIKQNDQDRWLDDNNRDWTHVVSGDQAPGSGRVVGWELLDHDIAVIDTNTYEVSYIPHLMNIGMALGFNAAKNKITLVGTDATNEIRYEPNLRGTFIRVKGATVDAETFESEVFDLNPHLDYEQQSVRQEIRNLSTGDPRGVSWNVSGNKGYVAGMGSNNVIVIDENGGRLATIDVGEGPVGVVLDESHQRMYVWNHFEASLSVVDTASELEIYRVSMFNPLPSAIKEGRKFLYSTHETSGLGQASCASCHVDGRTDRLAWDLGDPSGEVKTFNQNCQTTLATLDNSGCDDFHPMKGPMMTQTFQDIIGHEPFHWRGDKDGLEEFNGAFMALNGDDQMLRTEEMQKLKDMLSTITFPPNPFRNIDNTLPDSVDLSNQYTSGRFAPAGEPLGSGDPRNGLSLYNSSMLDGGEFQCASCHTLPTGMAVNGPLILESENVSTGGEIMPLGPSMENHLGIVSVDEGTQKSFKTAQLRNMYEKVGFEMSQQQSLSGFGFLHDGSVDSLSRFFSLPNFNVESDQEIADLIALMMTFSGSDLDQGLVMLGNDAPLSQDTHAGVGQQYTLSQASQIDAVIDQFVLIAEHPRIDLMVLTSNNESYLYDEGNNIFVSSSGQLLTSVALMATASSQRVLTYQLIPEDSGQTMAFDRDGDGIHDQQELIDGSNPADASSFGIVPRSGLWYNPQRNGHGADIQMAGENLLVVWYTYETDGTPTWYLSTGPYTPNWSAPLLKVQWDYSTNTTESQEVGELALNFNDARHTRLKWEIAGQSGQEDFQYFQFADGDTINQKTGTYYDANNPGWGVSINTQGQKHVAVAYYYDELGNPRWALGNGSNDSSSMLDMLSVQGACPGCAYQQPVFENIGNVSIAYSDVGISQFSAILDYPQNTSQQWRIIDVPLTAITAEFQAPENH